MLKDIQGYLVDEQYDGYNAKIDKFMNNSKNESIKEDYDEYDYEDTPEEMHKERYVTYFETQEGRQKYTIYHVYTDSTDDSYNELCDKRDNQLGMYNSYKELKDALKERAEKIAAKQGWTVKSIENLGEDDEYYRERNKNESIKEEVLPHNVTKVKQLIDKINKVAYFKIDGEDISVNKGFGTVGEQIDLQTLAKQFEELGFKVRETHFQITVYGLKDFINQNYNKNESIKESKLNSNEFEDIKKLNEEIENFLQNT